MKRCYLILLLLFPALYSKAQSAGLIEFGNGTQHTNLLCYDAGAAWGQSFFKRTLYCFGGVKMQKYSVVPPSKLRGNEDDYVGQTTHIWNFSFYTGLRYSVNLFRLKKNSDRFIGLFPECRMYFSPLLPYKIRYVEDNYPEPDKEITIKGDKISQLAYSIGGGIYFGNYKEAYLALKFETSTIDLFESIRQLDYKNDRFAPKGYQYIISLSLYGIIN